MHSATIRTPTRPIALVAALALVALASGLVFAAGPAPANTAGTLQCGDVVVKFQPEGSGGAHAINATGLGCKAARGVAKSCIEGDVESGWTAVLWDSRFHLAKGSKRIVYTPVGGGGCGYLPESCQDFSYRGVGFFGMETVGAGCGTAKSTAKQWYDEGGNCSFGNACDVGPFSCNANAATATITCTRQNGFRFRWQMGE